LASCTGSQKVYQQETFDLDSPFQHLVPFAPETACTGAKLGLLGQGYIVESAEATTVKGKKAFRTSGEESTFLEMSVVCAPRGDDAIIFANGLQTVYAVKKNLQAASVGLSALGTISLPVGGTTDSMVKVGDETVTDRDFYQRFFAVVDFHLERLDQSPSTTPSESTDARPTDSRAETPTAPPGGRGDSPASPPRQTHVWEPPPKPTAPWHLAPSTDPASMPEPADVAGVVSAPRTAAPAPAETVTRAASPGDEETPPTESPPASNDLHGTTMDPATTPAIGTPLDRHSEIELPSPASAANHASGQAWATEPPETASSQPTAEAELTSPQTDAQETPMQKPPAETTSRETAALDSAAAAAGPSVSPAKTPTAEEARGTSEYDSSRLGHDPESTTF